MTAQLIPIEMDQYLSENRPSLKETLHVIVSMALELEVDTEEHFKKMTGLYAESKDWERRIEFLRKEANGPDQDRISSRNDKAKEILAPLKQIQTIAKQKCEKYHLILEQRKQQEEKQLAQAADILGLDEVPLPMPLEKSVRGDGALMYTRVVRKFRTTDIGKVPIKYLMVNEDLIKQDISLGVSEIPGIEIYEEKITQLKVR